MAEPAPTRRSSRRGNAESATPVEVEVVPPLSRRAARARQHEAVGGQPAVEVPVAVVVQPAAEAPAEPVVTAPVAGAEPAVDAASDAFAAACRAFSSARSSSSAEPDFGAGEPVEDALPAEATTVHIAPRKRKARSKFLAVGATVGVMGIAGMIAVSMTLPVEAVAAAGGTQATMATSLVAQEQVPSSESTDDEIQAFVAPSDVQNDALVRAEDFSSASLIDIAAERGINFSSGVYTNDPDAAIQWPFVVGVGMSSGFGMRNGRMHEGIDLVPGAGAPIQAIADGTVRIATESGGAFGVTAYIDHLIDGQVVTSHYSHMQYGSLRVVPGQTVKVGDIIGSTGNTGRSYGAHLHFEIIINGATIDPLPWMQENTGRYEY